MLVAARNPKQRKGPRVAGRSYLSRFPAVATARAAQTPAARERFAAGHTVRLGAASRRCSSWSRRCFASAAVLLAYTREITFLLDDWEFLLYRPGFTAHSVFDPHNEHIVVVPVLIYKALLALFGMDSARPFQVASIATFLASAVAPVRVAARGESATGTRSRPPSWCSSAAPRGRTCCGRFRSATSARWRPGSGR